MKLFSSFLLLSVLFLIQTCQVIEYKPAEDGIIYIWKNGDTISSVSSIYGVKPSDLQRENDIYDPNDLAEGIPLFIPNNIMIAPEDLPDQSGEPALAEKKNQTANPRKELYQWPVGGSISSGYGRRWKRMHYGIDLRSDKGRDVKAAMDGYVEFSGVQRGFGNVVILKHPNGDQTLYAHNSKNYVSKGDTVRKGEKISYMGSTGRSTGVHLHFELHVNDRPIDPVKILPERNS